MIENLTTYADNLIIIKFETEHLTPCRNQIKTTKHRLDPMGKTMLSGQLSTSRFVRILWTDVCCLAKADLVDLVNCYKTRTFDEEITRLE